MDEVTRAVELTKARILAVDASAIRVMCHKAESHEELKGALLELASSMDKLRADILSEVAKFDTRRN